VTGWLCSEPLAAVEIVYRADAAPQVHSVGAYPLGKLCRVAVPGRDQPVPPVFAAAVFTPFHATDRSAVAVWRMVAYRVTDDVDAVTV